jgi:three-Cys-motif partner protein
LEDLGQLRLLELPKVPPKRQKHRWARQSIWTDNKALLIKRYLAYFVYVTHHGSYIDGFAGPQDKLNNWAAKLVLESEPKWLRHFFLCEFKASPYAELKKLCDEQPPVGKGKSARTIDARKGDFNKLVFEFLKSPFLTEKEATFCLLDQRTFECHWSTVEALARHKKAGNKIELFYFLACAWFDRAMSRKRHPMLDLWWGNDGWKALKVLSDIDRAQAICDRMTGELWYKSAQPFPIYKKGGAGRVMYYMIHATDYPIAPALMVQAYNRAVTPLEPPKQIEMFIEEVKGEIGVGVA